MAKWFFEAGHTAAQFAVRHMMVTDVRGHFKNIHGTLDFDPQDPKSASLSAKIDAREIWTGDRDRDAHLRSADFLDVERYPEITFTSKQVELLSENEAVVTGDLTIRGMTREASLSVRSLGQWETPWWEGNVDKGPKTRAGFVAETRVKRYDFGVSWNSALDKGGVVVGNTVRITIDAEAVLEG